MQRLVVGLWMGALLVVGIPALAQKQNPLVGTWEMVSITVDGKEQPLPAPRANGIQAGIVHWVFTTDGCYINLNIPKGRPQITTPQDQWTKEDWQNRYQGVTGQFGTYSISGDKLTQRPMSAMNPVNEGKDFVFTFRIVGADLILVSTGTNGSKTERRLRRMK
jgi:hypothetical protein